MKTRIMTVDRKDTEVFDRSDQMYAEGTSIEADLEPKESDIIILLGLENWKVDNVKIWFDTLQKFWRWSCEISKMKA